MLPASLRIATYNILADSYVDRRRYAHVDPQRLAPAARHPALVQRMLALNADVLCLQEVEAALFEMLEAELAPHGYSGILAMKLHGKPDGCAIFLRQPGVTLLEQRAIHFADGAGPDGRSGHLVLVARVECGIGRLSVLCTHLKWDPDDKPPGQHAGEQQVEEILQLCAGENVRRAVVCGDFNAEPSSRLVQRMLTAGFLDAYASAPRPTCNANHRARRIDYVFHAPALICLPETLPAIGDDTPLPGPGEPSDHLPLAVTAPERLLILPSYDRYSEFLEYGANSGRHRIVAKEEIERSGGAGAFGLFTREGNSVFGVYATPDGPVFFHDALRIRGAPGALSATVEVAQKTQTLNRFRLFQGPYCMIDVRYAQREGIGTNPYDTTLEDVDLFALIASRIDRREFFERYTREWTDPERARPANPT